MKREKQATHIVIIRRIDDEESRWQLVNFATSQRAANELARHPVDQDGTRVIPAQGDIIAAGPMEIANPLMIGAAKIFIGNGREAVEAKMPKGYKINPLEFWEGENTAGDSMVRMAEGDVDDRRMVLAAAACAESVLDKIEVRDRWYPSQAIQAARSWATGNGTKSDAMIAAARARSDLVLNRSRSEAIDAARAAAGAAETVGGQSNAFYAVSSAAAATGDHARGLLEMAEIVRRYIPTPVFLFARAGIQCPLPIPRDNPRRRR